jgi:HSP20 family protein
MAISYWDPFREVVSMQNRLNSLLQDYNRGTEGNSDVTAASFAPAVDVYEDEHKLVLNLEVPGVKQEDLDVQVEKNTLTVRGERKFEKDQKEQNFHRIERRYGTFYRSFSLPGTVDTENIRASYDAGVLKLELAKKAEAKPKQIKVNIGSGSSSPAAVGSGSASTASYSTGAKSIEGSKSNAAAHVNAEERELATV